MQSPQQINRASELLCSLLVKSDTEHCVRSTSAARGEGDPGWERWGIVISVEGDVGKGPVQFSPVQFSCSVVSDSLRPHESQHARPPCPSPSPGVYSNSCPSSWWCHPAISSSVVPFSFCPQSLPASGSLPMSQLFAWGGQSTGVSASLRMIWENVL